MISRIPKVWYTSELFYRQRCKNGANYPDAKIRHAQRWYYQMGKRVWLHEVFGFLFRDKRLKKDYKTVKEFWGEPQDAEEEALVRVRPLKKIGSIPLNISHQKQV